MIERDRLAVQAAVRDFAIARQSRTTITQLVKIIDETNCAEVVRMLPAELVSVLRIWASKDWSRPLHDANGPMSAADADRFRAKVRMIRTAVG